MKTAFIYKNTCHPVTQAYAHAIEATPYKIIGVIDAIDKAIIIPSYNYYFIESAMSMVVPITKRIMGKKCKIIYRGNDGLFGEKTAAYLHSNNPIKRCFLKFFIYHMDGISVESEKQINEVREYTHVPVEVCESFVKNKKQLEKIKPRVNTNTFLFIGEYRPPYDHKGIQFLIEVCNNIPECKLIIIGKNTKQLEKYAKKNITILDYVDNMTVYWKQATFYIHLPKYEAGPITLLEAMIAGLIPITNTNAGHADIVKKINKDLVLYPATQEATARQIRDLIKMPIEKRKKISETFKKNAAFLYAEKEMTAKFQKTWNRLIT